ncbi:MAG: hypothetical protein WCJ55_14105 [Chloroflexales bacterium]
MIGDLGLGKREMQRGRASTCLAARRPGRIFRKTLAPLSILVIMSLGSAGCAQQPATERISDVALNTLAQKTIFFGHQSVGWNIIQGIERVIKAQPGAQLTITKAEGISGVPTPALIHTEVGRNSEPLSKLQAFERFVRGGVGDRADIALFKFCYVDFDKTTDIDQLFAAYKQTMADLSNAYPRTRFAYVTAPLMAPEQGVKSFLNGLLGRNDAARANLKRHQFNEILRREYTATGALFDLAKVEATYPDGGVCTVSVDSQSAECLAPTYTDDGGHLNELGGELVARQFLEFLATLR